MVSYFNSETGMVIGFSQLGARGSGQPAFQQLQAFDFVNLMGAAAGAANLGFPLSATGQNLAYRRAAFDAVGGFHQVAHRISGDDVLLLQLIRNHTPWKIRFANDAAAYAISEPETTFRGFFNQRLRWASNGPYQVLLNIPFFLYLLAAFGSNVGLLFTLFGWLGGVVPVAHFGAYLLIKFILEFIVAYRAAHGFSRMDLLGYFPLWFCLQPFYVLLMGTLSLIGRFSWKGRRHDIPGQ
jgi:cellulose synthase/poly-beta-1,6-N-acetylglucosamine synthase-like glycosyltransferase